MPAKFFAGILSFAPQSLDEITDKLHARFPKKDKALLESEVESFLQDLEEEGVIVSGNTDADLAQKDKL
jgi:hypothetical protein